jgi:hypothetical protein
VLAGHRAQPYSKAVLKGASSVPRSFVLARLAAACKLHGGAARPNSPPVPTAAVPDCLNSHAGKTPDCLAMRTLDCLAAAAATLDCLDNRWTVLWCPRQTVLRQQWRGWTALAAVGCHWR